MVGKSRTALCVSADLEMQALASLNHQKSNTYLHQNYTFAFLQPQRSCCKLDPMPAPPTDDVVRGDENGEGRAEARQGSLSLVDALRHKLIRQAAQVAPLHRQTAQGQAGGFEGGLRRAR